MAQRHFLNVNGKIIDSGEPFILANNRAFRYGDSLFESFRAFGQDIPLFSHHLKRLLHGMKLLKMFIPITFSEEYMLKEIQHLLRVNKFFNSAVIRFMVFRNSGGKYCPETNTVSYLIETFPLKEKQYQLNEKGFSIGVFSKYHKTNTPFSGFKTGNAQLFIAASIYAKEKGWDDALIVNNKNEIIEATSSNVFFVQGKYLYTASDESEIVPGIMRQQVIEAALKAGYIVYDEVAVKEKNMKNFDEIFLTNSVRGIQWVAAFKNTRYFKSTSQQLIQKINERLIGS